MKAFVAIVFSALTLLIGNFAYALSETEVKQAIIAQSIASYSGNCPCPYNTDRAGRKCGKRSAYLRAGGSAPLCYPDDVTADMVRAYLENQ